MTCSCTVSRRTVLQGASLLTITPWVSAHAADQKNRIENQSADSLIRIGDDSILVQPDSVLEIEASASGISQIHLLAGSVHASLRAGRITSHKSHIQVLEGASFVKIHSDHDYVCICHGDARINRSDWPVRRAHHDAFEVTESTVVAQAYQDHSDDELMALSEQTPNWALPSLTPLRVRPGPLRV